MIEQLGERLIAAGVVTSSEVAEAKPADVGTGTRFVRALVTSVVSEDALAGFFVAEGAGPLASREEMDATPKDISALVPGEMARSLHALPIAVDGQALVVAMLDPWDKHALRELTRVTGREILPRVARHLELLRAIEQRHPMTNRAQRSRVSSEEPVLELVRRRAPAGSVNQAPSAPEPVMPLVRRKAVPTPAVPPQRTFERPHENQRTFSGRRTAEYKPAPTPPTPAPPTQAAAKTGASAPKTRASAPQTRADSAGASRKDPFGEPEHDVVPVLERPAWENRRSSAPPPEPHPLDSWGPLSESRPPPAAPEASVTLPQLGPTLTALRDASTRDELVAIATEATCALARGAVLLAIRRDVLKGWDGRGPGVSAEAVRNLWIPVKSPGVLRDVVQSGEHHVGPYGDTAADQLFRAAIAGGNGTLVVEGLKVAGRTVALLCADGVTGGPRAVERVEVIAQATAEGLERLVREAKRSS